MIHLEKISLNQLICLVILTQLGVGVLSIPFEQSRHSGFDSWMSMLIGGVIAQFVILIIYHLGKRYAVRPLPQYISAITGKWLGAVLNFLFAAYFLESSLMVVVSYSDVLYRWVLYETPWFVLIGISFAIAAYIASSGLRTIGTITQVIMVMFMICFFIIFISGMGKGDMRHFLPIGSHGLLPILKGSLPAFWSYAGYELLLYTFPFVQSRKKKDIVMAMSIANGFTTFFYVLISVIVTYNFSESQLKSISEPMVFILRKFNWPILQSVDILFMTIWLSVTTVTVYVYLFLSARYLAHVRCKEITNHPFLVFILALLGFVAGLWGYDRQVLIQFSKFHNKATIITIAIIPTILFLVSLARGKVAKG
ncbi:GerAB/ArcD/ProY family transporter [Cytobacillus oceanisediminis]|uniref:GerAB/ArcD/ProY family transporter n=1 Tax=Cytobacillus oceanisediminis TaxID=665099 RepID=UPI0037369362